MMMRRSGFFQDLLSTLFERRPWRGTQAPDAPLETLCEDLLGGRGEISGMRIGAAILDAYRDLDADGRRRFFAYLTEDMDLDADAVEAAAQAYRIDRNAKTLQTLADAAEPRRQELLRRLNRLPGATAALVRMREDLLAELRAEPSFTRTDLDFAHLFSSWFNRGFLVLRRIDWTSPAHILEKIIAYEAVHQINDWDDLRRRLHPADRRCFAFFHPAMPDEPLVFVEVALTDAIPNSIQAVLSEDREPIDVGKATTAVFYSISNCQTGLKGISFGNSLIKQVVQDLSAELRNLSTFVTLSPVPGFTKWLGGLESPEAKAVGEAVTAALAGDTGQLAEVDDTLRRLAADYFLKSKRDDGRPIDPVARFHLGNGAILHAIHARADLSPAGLKRGAGLMVNYLYDGDRVEPNHESFAKDGAVVASSQVEALLRG
ncbi:malonyl-CoA decarboxylase [Pacificispira spongiicola]|nr:malonyl-CoA decarboxylase [Pacificispira spongiicola]